MPKSIKKSRKYKHKNKRKSRRRLLKAGNGQQIRCCMCEKVIKKDENTLTPSGCLMKYGKASHKICQDCWWNPKTGFAREDASHKCPGCEKGFPLTPFEKEKPITMDLTED